MNCPNCGSKVSDKKKRCERCGADLTIYKKINSASNLCYNNGLAKARVRDLSGAIIALRNSLEFNKTNTDARNLLGLIYYETGDTVAALSEWVISKHLQPTDNDADDYISRVQSNLTKLDDLNQAIKRYNTALKLAKQGSEDLAVIQLKKVTSLNPNFIRAYQLLALLYIKAGDKEKAKKCLIRAGKIDISNTTTLRYLREIEAPSSLNKDSEGKSDSDLSNTNSIMPISSYREDKPNIIAFVNLVIGVIIGIAVMAFLVVPTIKKNQVADGNSTDTEYISDLAKMEEKDNTIASLQQDNEELKYENEQLQTKVDSIVVTEDNTDTYTGLIEAAELYLVEQGKAEGDRDYSAVADILSKIDDTQLKDDAATSLYTTMKTASYPEAAVAYYESGHALYTDGKYEEALIDLAKAMIFDPTDVSAIYFTGRSYQRLEDKENAAIYYQKVITDYPDSSRVTDAKGFLKEVQK
ncbi:MAG: tetratricopeptide repeat protein [Mobilitalea sp.]